MTEDRTSFTEDDLNSIIKEFENTIQRSQLLASRTNHINTLQTKQIERCQTTIDKSSKRLQDVEHEIDELEKNFCIRLCCSSKSKKSSSKKSSINKSRRNKSNSTIGHIEQDVIRRNDGFQNLDENLQRLQHFNILIDHEIQDQFQILKMYQIIIIAIIFSRSESLLRPYSLISSTSWANNPETFYTDFSASLTPDQRPSIFQYSYNNTPTLFICYTRQCSNISIVSMPGLYSAQFALAGVSPRRIQQYSPHINGAQFYLSLGYRTPNKNVELVTCLPSDSKCNQPLIQNTVNSPGFGQAGLRLTFTREGLPILIIPQASYASVDNRVTGYTVQICQDPSCQQGLAYSSVSLPFNLTGKAYCEGTSVDVALNRFGFSTWLTLCGPELNLIHCLTQSCNQTSVASFGVNQNYVYFVYLAVDSQFRFSISTNGQTSQSDITHIRCLDPDCTKSIQSQYVIPSRMTQRQKLYGVQVQHVIDPKTDLPVFHFIGAEYPSNKPLYMFIACGNIECTDMTNIVDYGTQLEVNQLRVADVFVDDQGTIIASSRVNYIKTNQTMNLIVRIARMNETKFKELAMVQPSF
ncbi:unnamed protein product [Rotaria socialis]|uniref:Uncharacterized protein n=2 Tax=Rotaria socialis TaxID=392032 RepID=A0A820ZDK3_9BILA|nr:unnamed protein product [Rotaria socialis]